MKKILVINNDFDTMALLKTWLERKTYEVKYTGNQEEVPEIVKEFRPELVIVDVLQKDVAEQLKENEKTRSVPVLLMTGYTLKQMNSPVPADDTIEKPFNLPLLEKKIERLIQRTA
jgi:two-component system alkaline phosphatase synthesis response regulator PhoP